jgi:hypothetical protein
MKVTEAVEEEGLPLVGHISGHPSSMGKFIEEGYRIITF